MFVLILNKENRVTTATYAELAPLAKPKVDALPEGNLSDYLYIDGEYVYSPLPKPPEPEPKPTQLDRVEAQATYTAIMTDTLLEV